MERAASCCCCCWRADSDLCLGGFRAEGSARGTRSRGAGRNCWELPGIAGNCRELLPHAVGAPPGILQEGSAGWALLARSILGQRWGCGGSRSPAPAGCESTESQPRSEPSFPARCQLQLLFLLLPTLPFALPWLLLPVGKADFRCGRAPFGSEGSPSRGVKHSRLWKGPGEENCSGKGEGPQPRFVREFGGTLVGGDNEPGPGAVVTVVAPARCPPAAR